MNSSIPPWLNRRLHTLKRTGVLTLIKEKNTDLSCFQLKDVMYYNNFIKTLDLTGTPIKSLEKLPNLPRLTNLILDYSEISNCINFAAVSTITSISLKKTPLSALPHYKLCILLSAGPNIVKIDGKMITQILINRYNSYPACAHDLVNNGWMVEYPCPGNDRLAQLCEEYDVVMSPEEDNTEIGIEEDEFESDVQADNDENKNINNSDTQNMKESQAAHESDFDALAQKLWNQHELMLQKKQALFGIIEEELGEIIQDESDFGDRVATLFKGHGIILDPTNENSILEAIDALCKRNEHKVPVINQK